METLGVILGVLIVVNLAGSIFLHNALAICGWLVALLEWTRRFTV